MTEKKIKLIEVCRSFGRKINLGGYETADFFESRKEEVPESEAEETSKRLIGFCKTTVEKEVDEYITSRLVATVPEPPEWQKQKIQEQEHQDNWKK